MPRGILAKNIIVSNLDIIPFEFPEQYFFSKKSWKYKHLYQRVKHLLQRASAVISISNYSRERLIDFFGVNSEKVNVVYLAPSELDFIEGKKDKSANKIKKPYILTIGGSEPRKNVQRVIDAYLTLRNSLRKSIDLIIVGKKWRDVNLEPLNSQNGISYFGEVTDTVLNNLYTNAVAFVYPSIYEGFGLPILEAMKCGCPVITSNSTSLKEIGGNACAFVEPYEVESIATVLDNVITNNEKRKFLIKMGYKKVEEFSWDITAKKIYNIIGKFV